MQSWQHYFIKGLLRCIPRTFFQGPQDILKVRHLMEKFAFLLPVAKNTHIEPLNLDGIPGEKISLKEQNPQAILFYLHGGGYCMGSLTTYRSYFSYLSKLTNSTVIAIQYRLAPEHPFPAALEDTYKAYRAFLKQDSSKLSIFIAGESAGGGLALATLLKLKACKKPLPTGVICFSPWVDLCNTGESLKFNKKTDLLLSSELGPIISRLYAREETPHNPFISPLYGNLKGVPPLFIQVSADEILLSDALRLSQKAEDQGVAVTLQVWPQMVHAWPILAFFLPEAREALWHVKKFIVETKNIQV